MLNVTELRSGIVFKENNNIYQVLSYDHVKMGRGSGNVKVKIRNLKTGTITEKSFITGARIDEAEIERRKVRFLDGDNFSFLDAVTLEQFSLSESVIGDEAKYLKDGLEVSLIVSRGEALGLELPNSLVYSITETGPGEKGNTVSSVFKSARLDNGMEVKVPMFAKVGDRIKVDTRTGQYVERVK